MNFLRRLLYLSSFRSSLCARQFVRKAARPMWHLCNQLIMDVAPLATVTTATFLCASVLMILCDAD